MRLLLAIVLSVWVSCAGAADRKIWSAKVDVQIVAIDSQHALTLLPQLQRDESSGAAVGKIQEMIADDEAELLGWPTLMAGDSAGSSSVGVEELRVPDSMPPLSSIPFNYRSSPPAVLRYKLPHHYTQHWGAQVPPSIEIRNLGPTLAIEPSVNETGTHITVSIMMDDLEFGGFQEFSGTPSPGKIAGVITATGMRFRRLHSSLTVEHGKRVLLASYMEQRPKPRVVLYLLRARAMGVPTK